MPRDESLRLELLAMVQADQQVREELALDGSLYEDYHPRMEEIHNRNAARLQEIIQAFGWPAISVAGKDGAEAAWLVAQHAISHPDLQRKVLRLLKKLAPDEREPWQLAYLEDRIRSLEGRLQLYGTQFDWDENGFLSPYPAIENPDNCEKRRQEAGLRPLGEAIRYQREVTSVSNEKPPKNLAERRKKMEEWARSVGWR
jgi:hypothetical protein